MFLEKHVFCSINTVLFCDGSKFSIILLLTVLYLKYCAFLAAVCSDLKSFSLPRINDSSSLYVEKKRDPERTAATHCQMQELTVRDRRVRSKLMTQAQKRKYHHLDEHKSRLFLLLSIKCSSTLALPVEVSYKGLHAGVKDLYHIPPAHPSPSCFRQRPLMDGQGESIRMGQACLGSCHLSYLQKDKIP